MSTTERRLRMQSMMDDIWFMERDLVSDGFDRALDRLSAELPLIISEYPSGAEAWTWIIPDKWTCHEAYIETLGGERLIDRQNNPLHCASYSASFDGVVTREELFDHLQVNPDLPKAIPFAWIYYRSDWGLCCSAEQKERLTDEKYRVVIRSEHTPGTLKVGEYLVKGKTDKEIVLCAHLCHPCMANDDMSGVAVGIEVMRQLELLGPLLYTYRLLLTPETIGSIAWLSAHEEIIPYIKGGLFLEMLGTDCPHALQMTYQKDTEIDRCFLDALEERDSRSWHGSFRRVIGNDERQFNAPGVRVPMLSLSRVFHPDTGKWPYPTYHSSEDTPDAISWDNMEDSVETVLHMIQRLEENRVPVNLFRGEVFCSRYGLFIDFYEDPDGNRKLFDIIQMVDGTHTVSQIASATGASFGSVMEILKKMEGHDLIRFSDSPSDALISEAARIDR
jgi:aminopeptidase-like protein